MPGRVVALDQRIAADIDEDGRREIFYGTESHLQTVRWVGHTYAHRDYAFSGPSVDLWVGDIDGDEKLEMITYQQRGAEEKKTVPAAAMFV